MMSTVHLLVGAAIGKALGNLWLIIPVAFLSHYILDLIPHWNAGAVKNYLENGLRGADKKDLFLKSVQPMAGLILVVFFICQNKDFALLMALGALFAMVPDFLLFFRWKFGSKTEPTRLYKIHRHHHLPFILGITVQIIICLLAIFYILG